MTENLEQNPGGPLEKKPSELTFLNGEEITEDESEKKAFKEGVDVNVREFDEPELDVEGEWWKKREEKKKKDDLDKKRRQEDEKIKELKIRQKIQQSPSQPTATAPAVKKEFYAPKSARKPKGFFRRLFGG